MWISFIGFMASGKSSAARALGEATRLPVVDLDAAVAGQAGRALPDIFATEGVAGFRARESRALADLDPDGQLLLATGGGVVEGEDNVRRLRAGGPVIWLDVPWEAVRRRLGAAAEAQRRPLVEHLGWGGLELLFRRRQRLYAGAADFRLRADLESPLAVARQALARALQWWERHDRDAAGGEAPRGGGGV